MLRKGPSLAPGRTRVAQTPLSTSGRSERALTSRRPLKREADPWLYHIIPGDTCLHGQYSTRVGCWFQSGYVHAGHPVGHRRCFCEAHRPGETTRDFNAI